MNVPPGTETPTFSELHRAATGYPPPRHQARVAATGLPAVIPVPAGSEKAGVILAWLWRRLHGPAPVRAVTARRLIWALPHGSLLEPLAAEVRGWLARLELTEAVALHVVAGGRGQDVGDWRENMHLPAIIVGTADTLVSRALNRGYGLGRSMFPIDFGLTVNGAHWVIDEPRLCPQSTVTLRQLAELAGERGTAEPFGLSLVSVMPRAAAPLTFRRLAAGPGDYRSIAASVADRHAPGTRTLVVLNSVDAAQQVYQRLRGGPADVTLLHSRLRGIERGDRLTSLSRVPGVPAGQIVVATPVVEAGIGHLGAALVITEAAPWPSLVLRARHCDRSGGPGEVVWVAPGPSAYDRDDLGAVTADLARVDGERLTGEALTALGAPFHGSGAGGRHAVIQPGQLTALFDTYLPDDDLDIAPYVRDGADLDVEVAWATWTTWTTSTGGEDGAPAPAVRHPAPEYRCRVPIGAAVELAKDRTVWRFDRGADRWVAVTQQPASRPRPGELLLINAADGGYDTENGFRPSAPGPVAGCPELLTQEEAAERAAAPVADAAADAAGTAGTAPRRWQSLDEHSEQVRDQAAALLAVLAPSVPPQAAAAAVVAGYLHDVGKAHPIWQDALCAVADDDDRDEVAAGRPWAKSGETSKPGRLEFAGGPGFRHELASLMLLDGPLRALLAASPDPDLTRFLVLAHHGRLRVQVRDVDERAASEILGLEQGARSSIPPLLGQPASTLTVDLGQFHPGGGRSWSGTAAALVSKYGPFRLAFLEALVRMADWRASGGRELPAHDEHGYQSPRPARALARAGKIELTGPGGGRHACPR